MRVNVSSHDLKVSDHKHHLHPFTEHGTLGIDERRVISRADGVWLWDTETASWTAWPACGASDVGHGRQEIAEAVRAQMSELSYYNTFFKTTHPPVIELSQMLSELAPEPYQHGLLCRFRLRGQRYDPSPGTQLLGAEGTAGKKVVISRKNAYHGSTVAGASLGGMDAMHSQGGLPIPDIHHIDQPYWFGEGMMTDMSRGGVRTLGGTRNSNARSTRSAKKRSPPSWPSRSRAPAGSSFRRTATGRKSSVSWPNAISCLWPTR
jgi:putrescine aminotransferase